MSWHQRSLRVDRTEPVIDRLRGRLVGADEVMVTSNLPFGRWGETFSDDVVAAAMIDRLVHHAEVLTLSGDSYRTRSRRELLTKNRSNRD